MKILFTMVAAACVAVASLSPAEAAWPERPIKVVVPFKAGGSSDLVARSFAAAIDEGKLLNQPITVVNVGGHSSVGARRVLDAKPDGYEFLLHETGIIGAEAAGIINFGYKDYKPIAATGSICMAILTRKDSGFNDLNALIAAAKAKPGEVIFGVNLGGLNHMSGILIENSANVKFRFVQIGGSADNFAALTGGQTAVASVGAAGAKNFTLTKDGKPSADSLVQTIALLADEPHPRLPGIKTAKQQGQDVQFCFTNYWFAPKNTPDDVVASFAGALEKAATSDRVKKFYEDTLSTPVFFSGDAFAKHLDDTAKVVAPIAKQAAQSK